jgi:hypothetical protein
MTSFRFVPNRIKDDLINLVGLASSPRFSMFGHPFILRATGALSENVRQ